MHSSSIHHKSLYRPVFYRTIVLYIISPASQIPEQSGAESALIPVFPGNGQMRGIGSFSSLNPSGEVAETIFCCSFCSCSVSPEIPAHSTLGDS